MSAMQEWQPIETAPKDGTLVDLWCVDPFGESEMEVRLTDCSWHEPNEVMRWEGWVRITDDGGGDAVEAPPTAEFGLPAWKPTHWMPRPAAPANAEEASK